MKHKLYNRLLSLALAVGLVIGMLPSAAAVVNDPDTHLTHTYNFYNDEQLWNTQILSTGETLNQPQTPDKEGKVFEGWYTEKNGGELFDDYGVEGQLTQSITTNLYARYSDAYYVFYKDGKDGRILYTQTYGNGDTVDWSDVPYATSSVDEALIGWSVNPDANTPDAEPSISGADITLYPVVANAHWITYHSQGGSVVDPAYVLTGDTTVCPKDPTRQGYTFDGWYTNPECTIPFTFGSELQENVDLYAKWTPGQSRYTVVYWLENANDNGYTYDSKVEETGATGTNAGYDSKSYKGFTLNQEKTNQAAVTISGDGTTIRNVYYNRKTYTLTFQIYKSGWFGGSWEDVYEQKNIKYGQSVQTWWDEASNEYDGYLWYTSNSMWDNTFYTAPPTMPDGNLTIYGKESSGRSTIYYYEQNTDNQIREPFRVNSSGWSFTEEDFIEIPGFTYYRNHHDSGGWGGGSSDYYIYYTRNRYNIEFTTNGGPAVNNITGVLYEADISNRAPQNYVVGETTKNVNGQTYYFAGWYDNEALAGDPFSFRGQKMPAHNLLLYAKWDTRKVTVTFDVNGGTPEIDSQTVPHGTPAEKPESPTREGFQFAGWTRNGKPFNFGTPITEDTTLVAQWISSTSYSITYDPGTGTGNPVTDEKMYASGTNAKVLSVPDSFAPPVNYYGFVCWNTKKDGTGTNYYPGGKLPMPEANVTLYAQWAPNRSTTLTYDYNDGTDTKKTVTIKTPNDRYAIDREAVSENPGWRFIGWSTEKEPASTENLLQKDDVILVDTISPEKNVLYAQWEKTGTLVIEKTFDGLSEDEIKSLNGKLTFTVTGVNSPIVFNTNSDSWQKGESNEDAKKYTYTYSVEGLTSGEYSVTESGYTLDGYNWQGTTNPVKVTVTAGESIFAPFTNTYTPANINLTITKKIEGDPYGDGRDMFSFRITCIDCADDTNIGKVWYVHINGEGSKTITLPVGKYEVEELSNMHYEFVKVEPEPEILNPTTRAIEYYGYDLIEDKTITFTNEPVTSNIPSDGGGVENHFDKYEDGKIVWKPEEYGDDGEIQPKPTPEPSGE